MDTKPMAPRSKTISMDLQVYNEDLSIEYNKGVRDAHVSFIPILRAMKAQDYKEVLILLCEEFNDSGLIETAINALDLQTLANEGLANDYK